jgi:Zn-finger nucleic acid-binding protein
MTEKPPETLRCPSCGAPATAGAARCEYCHAVLATVSCPSCFEVVFQGAAFCPHCGTALTRSQPIDQQTTPCPACRGAMHWVKVGSTDLLECDACDGTWLEASTFERLCADRERQAAVLQHKPSEQTPASNKPPAAMHYRPCPRCGKLMNRINFGRRSGTIVDVCSGHGTFLDRGELHQVVQFILDGGLERARQLERDDLIEQQHRLHDLDRGQAQVVLPSLGPPSGWDSGTLRQFLSALLPRSD